MAPCTRREYRRRSPPPPAGARSPGQLDLQLALVISDLDLDLQADLVGHPDGDTLPAAGELDGVVAGQRVRERVQACRGLLAAHTVSVVEVEQLHVVSLVGR